jgi:alkylation response protein AidB-like acyl-CoA dehydrogenase
VPPHLRGDAPVRDREQYGRPIDVPALKHRLADMYLRRTGLSLCTTPR